MAKKPRAKRTKIPPRYKAEEAGELDRHWQTYFLDKLAETSNVTAAADYAGASPARAYRLRREDARFAWKWNAALMEGYSHLEMETLRRLREGTAADGAKFDIGNALRLLALHRETIARQRAAQSSEDEASVLAALNAKLDAMRNAETPTPLLLPAPDEDKQ